MSSIDFSKIETINVDLVVGFGAACRVAQALKRNNLRFFSSPFDWMMDYSLGTAISIISNFLDRGNVFFNNCYEDKNNSCGNYTVIIDKDCGMISMHDFPKYLPIEDAPQFFHKKYQRRFSNLNFLLKSAKKVCFLTYREISLNEMKTFIRQINQLYKFKHIYFINIYDTLNKDIESFEKIEDDNVTYLVYKFNDEHENGRDKSNNPDFWLGNIEFWDKILKTITLNENFKRIYEIKKFIFNITNDCSTTKPHYIVQVLGVRLKFKLHYK